MSFYTQTWHHFEQLHQRQRDQVHPQQLSEDTKLGGAADTPEGWEAIQRDLERLEKQVHGNLTQQGQVQSENVKEQFWMRFWCLVIAGELDKITFNGPL